MKQAVSIAEDVTVIASSSGTFEQDRVYAAGQSQGSSRLRTRQYRLGRIRMDALTYSDLLSLFADAIDYRSSIVVLHHNLHGIHVQHSSPPLDAVYEKADWVYVDGMPVVWLAKAAGFPFEARHRITLLDCFEDLLGEAARNNWRVFYFGGNEEVLAAGLGKLRSRFPSLAIAGRNGYVSTDETMSLIQEIDAFRPDILFVGLGMPLQEEWIATHRSLLNVPVITTCGATMEYVTGYSYRPPAWTSKLGLYGVARLISRPKRLWKRYLLEPLLIAPYLASVILRQRLQVFNKVSDNI